MMAPDASIHLDAAMPNFQIQEYHAEFYEPHYFEVIKGLPRQENGVVTLPTGVGLGITVDDEVLGRYPYVPLGMATRGI